MTETESPLEVFKRSTAAVVRALAERDDIQVGFSNEPPHFHFTRRPPFAVAESTTAAAPSPNRHALIKTPASSSR